MERHFKDWIGAYVDTYRDDYIPEKFFHWAAISIIAAALERRVWLPISKTYSAIPNMYIMIIAGPGTGKSSAIKPAYKMLRDLKSLGKEICILPNQVTEAKLMEMLTQFKKTYEYRSQVHYQTAAFYFASEARSSLKNIYGDFTALLTDLYDGNEEYSRATKKDGRPMVVIRPCINFLAASTFDYMGELINDDSIMGGFASRITYVVQKEAIKRKFVWQSKSGGVDQDRYKMLLSDLHQIATMVGPFQGTPAFARAWSTWREENHDRIQAYTNEKMQHLLSRQGTMAEKLSMIMCASRSNAMMLDELDWERAINYVLMTEETLPHMIREGRAKDTKTQGGLNNYIMKELSYGPVDVSALRGSCLMAGFKTKDVEDTLQGMLNGKLITYDGGCLKLVSDANIHI